MSKTEPVRFSLVLPTLGRTRELERFLVCLEEQRFPDLELVIVDQNEDERLEPILGVFHHKFRIVHVRSGRGLSHGRNVGLKYITGTVVAFPDDDCWYPPTTLGTVARLLEAHPEWDGITGRSATNASGEGYNWFDRESGDVTKLNVWHRSTSYTIFLRRSAIAGVGDFDEFLGVGAASGRISAEEVDYLVRCLSSGLRIFYNSELLVCHEENNSIYDRRLIERGYGYSLGLGHVLRKHKYPIWFSTYLCLRALGGALVAVCRLDSGKADYHLAVLKGRVRGWLG